MAEINQYSVVWEISEMDAESPLQAAKNAQNWLRNDNWQFYIQDQKTKEIFSVDLEEEDAVLQVTGEYVPEIPAKLNKKKTYYLFGEGAVRTYSEDGINELVNEIEDDGLCFNLFCFIEGETSSIELMEAADGWSDYACITEEEYNILVDL